jgi:tetratricopeptide (TPR) repeat protein
MRIINFSRGGKRRVSPGRSTAVVCLFALSMIVFQVSGCGRGGSIAGKEPIKKVFKVEDNIGALRAWTVNKARASVLIHIDPADDFTVFPSMVMQDMKNAAVYLQRRNETVFDKLTPFLTNGGVVNLGYMAGMYKRVIWVVPTRAPVGETPPTIYRDFFVKQRRLQAAGVGPFETRGNQIVGSVAGIPLTITRLEDLTIGRNENAIIDIDLAYFPYKRREDRAYLPGMRTLLSFLHELAARNIRTNLVTVNYSIQAGLVSMDLRYFGDVIKEVLADPRVLSGPPPENWQLMTEAEDSMRAGRYASAEALYGKILETEKNDPGVYFALAVARGYQDKGVECRTALLDAYGLDAEYLHGFTQLARALGDAGRMTAGRDILDTPELTKILAPVELNYQKGVFYYSAHRPFDAITYLESTTAQRPKDFGLYSILFRAYREAGDPDGQRKALRKLVAIDDGRVRREMSWVYADLGQLYEDADSTTEAVFMYDKYIKANPEDSLSGVLSEKVKALSAKRSGVSKRSK